MNASFFLPLLLLSAASPPSTIHSHLLLQPNEQFVLGGDQPGAFRVAAQNTGPVPVEIRERQRAGALRTLAVLLPKQRARLSFEAGSTALLRNTAGQQAVLELDITGSKPSRMLMGPASGDGRL
ncbi:hypothetical protein [uncultured Hymenobacter sp.]|uniref:hypothetical protein n=1 Tax=uncultured Hymenobacter sp. TaxID=170016 RepID=UPI0035CACFF7